MRRAGFTLVELVIVIVILGILASVAIPRFVDLSVKAKEAATKGALGGMRAAVAIYYASQAAYGAANFPATTAQLSSSMAQGVPEQPYVTGAATTQVRGSASGEAKGTTSGTEGWAYQSSSGQVWANSATTTENTW